MLRLLAWRIRRCYVTRQVRYDTPPVGARWACELGYELNSQDISLTRVALTVVAAKGSGGEAGDALKLPAEEI